MITRHAIFEGHIPLDRKADFQAAVVNRLIPAIRAIPALESVTVSFCFERDDSAPEVAMFLVTTYPDMVSLKAALKGPERQNANDIAEGIFQEFGHCKVTHHLSQSFGPDPAL